MSFRARRSNLTMSFRAKRCHTIQRCHSERSDAPQSNNVIPSEAQPSAAISYLTPQSNDVIPSEAMRSIAESRNLIFSPALTRGYLLCPLLTFNRYIFFLFKPLMLSLATSLSSSAKSFGNFSISNHLVCHRRHGHRQNHLVCPRRHGHRRNYLVCPCCCDSLLSSDPLRP